MTEYAHNHPRRCCCIILLGPAEVTVCPLCPEHGELAQLGNDNSINGQRRAAGYPDLPAGVVVADLAYACCHQLVGRPHTDYCPAGRGITPEMQELGERMIADEIANTAADRGARFGMTHVPEIHTLDGDTHPVHECHPDRCGMWATQTTQPPTQTSQPNTQTRTGDFLEGARTRIEAARDQHADDRVLIDNKGQQRWHETGPDEAHETWRCDPAKCGYEPTPHATPTPGDAAQPCIVDGTPCTRWPGCRC